MLKKNSIFLFSIYYLSLLILMTCLISNACFALTVDEMVEVKQWFGKGRGYPAGHTSLTYFSKYDLSEKKLEPFFEFKMHYFHSKSYAMNVGTGMLFANSKSFQWGGNIYYDFRKTKHFNWHQLGLGIEILSPNYKFYFNGYFPLKEIQKGKKHIYNHFIGNFFAVCHQNELSIREFETQMEINIINQPSLRIYSMGGPYCLFLPNKTKPRWGGQLGLYAEIKKYFFVSLQTSYDPLFKSILEGTISLIIPFWNENSFRSKSQSIIAPYRQEIMPVIHDCCWNWNW